MLHVSSARHPSGLEVTDERTNLSIVFNEEEEHDVLTQVLDGQVEGEGRVCLEHVIQ